MGDASVELPVLGSFLVCRMWRLPYVCESVPGCWCGSWYRLVFMSDGCDQNEGHGHKIINMRMVADGLLVIGPVLPPASTALALTSVVSKMEIGC